MSYRVINDDAIAGLKALPDKSVHCCVTSPPYYRQRDYGVDGQIGREQTPFDYADSLCDVFTEAFRVLRDDGTLWLNLGDTYLNSSPVLVPALIAITLPNSKWQLRQDIIWHKPSAMPESVRSRFSRSHEHVLLFTKSDDYYFDPVAVPDFRRDVWTIPSKGYKGAHFAVMPEKLAEICIEVGTSPAGCCGNCGKPLARQVKRTRVPTRPGRDTKATQPGIVQGNRDPLRHVTKVETLGWEPACDCKCDITIPCIVLDPFAGAGTTLAVSERLKRDSVGIEINPGYCKLIHERLDAKEGVT